MKNKLLALDSEVLPNYFLLSFKGLESGKIVEIDMFGKDTKLSKEQRKRIHTLLVKYTTFGFNSINYDMPIINYALGGASCEDIYNLSKKIIDQRLMSWMTYRTLDIEPYDYDHFDVAEPSPAVMISLKNYGTRMGSPKLQDFYLDPHTPIAKEDVAPLKKYCVNDLNVTIDLYNAIEDRVGLREVMGEQYGLDLRSKSDAQIAEAVITSELKKLGVNAVKPVLDADFKASYVAPAYVHFDTPELQELLKEVQEMKFDIAANGSVKLPLTLRNKKIVIGNTTYKMGIGGLHSQEKSLTVVSNNRHVMRNADFDAYYPYIILQQGYAPQHLGSKFLTVYRNIVETRMKAKREGDKVVNSSLKIIINGSFGKFGSKYSKLYSPNMLLAVTITGQLTLLMLIEQLESYGIPVMSANTDGVEYYCPRNMVDIAEAIIFDLELTTGYTMEHGDYKALHARDVNNYVAVYDGYTKAKGIYAETTLSKGRSTPIVYTAVRKYLLDGTKIEHTITECGDMNEFVSARTVKGGGVYDGEYLGKMVRWYYSTASKGYISYKSNGNKVPKTDGCSPMMDMSSDVPDDLDYIWYFDEAIEALKNLGVDYHAK